MLKGTIYLHKFSYFLRLVREIGGWDFLYRYVVRAFYKITKLNQKMVLFNNVEMTLPYDSRFGTEIFLKGSKLDWGSEIILHRFLDINKDFIDVGANIGYYSLLAAPLSNQVYAFEPDPRMVEHLKRNLSQFQNCHVLEEALFSEPGTMDLNLNSMPELNSLVRHSPQENKVTVKVNTLDQLMSDYPLLSVSCIKTDAEGADFDILMGGKNLLIRDQPLVLSEIYPTKKLLEFIKSIEFTCFAFVKPKDEDGANFQPKFIKIETKPTNSHIKMIFLVPNRLLSRFEELKDV